MVNNLFKYLFYLLFVETVTSLYSLEMLLNTVKIFLYINRSYGWFFFFMFVTHDHALKTLSFATYFMLGVFFICFKYVGIVCVVYG